MGQFLRPWFITSPGLVEGARVPGPGGGFVALTGIDGALEGAAETLSAGALVVVVGALEGIAGVVVATGIDVVALGGAFVPLAFGSVFEPGFSTRTITPAPMMSAATIGIA